MTMATSVERDQLKSAKIAVLKLINEHKEILFGRLSETLTREVKESKWAEVADHAHALGAFPWHRSWDYLKDTTWQNWRKRFVEKRDKIDKYEKAGIGSKLAYDESDLLIMEILDSLGRNFPSSTMQTSFNSIYPTTDSSIRDISDMLEIEFDVKAEGTDTVDGSNPFHGNHGGIMGDGEMNANYSAGNSAGASTDEMQNECHDDVHTAYESQQNQSNYITTGDDSFGASTIESTQPPKIVSTSSLSAISRATALRKSAFSALRFGATNRKRPASLMVNNAGTGIVGSRDRELIDLKCRKIRAELELLHRESYKKDLEILQLERSLGLPASNITKKFYRSNKINPSIIMSNNNSN